MIAEDFVPESYVFHNLLGASEIVRNLGQIAGQNLLRGHRLGYIYHQKGTKPSCEGGGGYLGDLKSELRQDDAISHYVSAGPKNYTYQTLSGQHVCKVRGFMLNYVNSSLINFDSMKCVVTRGAGPISTVNPTKICKDKRKWKLCNRWEVKVYRMIYTKCCIVVDFCTV